MFTSSTLFSKLFHHLAMARKTTAPYDKGKQPKALDGLSAKERSNVRDVSEITGLVAAVDIKEDHLRRPDTPRIRKTSYAGSDGDSILDNDDFKDLETELQNISIIDSAELSPPEGSSIQQSKTSVESIAIVEVESEASSVKALPSESQDRVPEAAEAEDSGNDSVYSTIGDMELRVISWEDVCLEGDKIEKIAEASYAEVYRVTTSEGVSIIKVIRLQSPIKAQTATQKRSGLVDEEPHAQADLLGELRISECLADIPGFVVYKERYVVKGKAPKALLETHQAFHRKAKRQDPDRLQFYPSPSRYLDDTKFLVIELGDAGTALEDFKLTLEEQLWDVFFLVTIALARAEEMVLFEHRDLHEGNLCLRQVKQTKSRDKKDRHFFGFSGLDITILDYGLSRAEDPDCGEDEELAIACDLEQDLSLFTSTHADQCRVYRQMRSFLLKGERDWLPPERHNIPYEEGIEGPICWDDYAPYSNVLWLAYIYEYITEHFKGDKKQLASFKKKTEELWQYLNPDAKKGAPCFGSAEDVVRFAVEAGWVLKEQLMGAEASVVLEKDGDADDDVIDNKEPVEAVVVNKTPPVEPRTAIQKEVVGKEMVEPVRKSQRQRKPKKID